MEPVAWAAGFDDPGWLWQLKWDGVRCLAAVDGDGVRLWSRRGTPWTQRYPELAGELPAAVGPGRPALLDGEVVALDADGRPSFQLVLRRAGHRRPEPALLRAVPVVYAVFDALAWEGDIRRLPLHERLRLLGQLRPTPHILGVEAQAGGGVRLVAAAAAAGLEGAVAKRTASAYTAGQSADWRKVKPRRTLRALVVGYRAGEGGRLRSLCLAAAVGGRLVYVGDVGSGLDEALRARLRGMLAAAPVWVPPFARPAGRHWRSPGLGAEVSYAELTAQGHLRAPVLVRLTPLPGGPDLC